MPAIRRVLETGIYVRDIERAVAFAAAFLVWGRSPRVNGRLRWAPRRFGVSRCMAQSGEVPSTGEGPP